MKTFLILLLSGCCSLAGIQTGPVGTGGQTNGVTATQVTNIVLGVNVASQVITNMPLAGIGLGGGLFNNFVLITNTGGTYNGQIFFDKNGDISFTGGTIAANGTSFVADNGALTTDGSGDLTVKTITGNGAGLTNITPSNLTGLVTLVNTTNWISFPSIGWTNNTTSTYYQAYLTAGSSLTFKDANGNGIWPITTSLPFVVGPGNKITGTGITGSLQQMPF